MDKELYEKLKKYMNIAYEQKMLKTDYSYNNQFSFFMTISDQYKKENFHSDLLKVILNPSTIQIGNPEYLRKFLNIIGLDMNVFGNNQEIKNYVKVEREEHKVDVLIKYDNPENKKAIIIENKINDAVDQDNQLARYYEALTNDGYEVLKIPYITLFGGKIPDYDNWDNKYKNISNKIFDKTNPLFYELPVSNKEKCLIKFLNDCIEFNKTETSNNNNHLSLVLLEQYKLLLSKLVENTEMTPEEINNIEELFEDNKKEKLIALLKNWEFRGKCAYEYIVNKCTKDDVIHISRIHGSKCLVLEKQTNFYEGVYLYPGDSSIQIGFYRANNNWDDSIKKEAEKYLKKICNDFLNTKIESNWIYIYKNWYCVYIEIDTFNSFDEINTKFRKALIELSKFKEESTLGGC